MAKPSSHSTSPTTSTCVVAPSNAVVALATAIRTSAAPRHGCIPMPNARCPAAPRVASSRVGLANCAASRFAAAIIRITRSPATMFAAPMRMSAHAVRNTARVGLVRRSSSSTAREAKTGVVRTSCINSDCCSNASHAPASTHGSVCETATKVCTASAGSGPLSARDNSSIALCVSGCGSESVAFAADRKTSRARSARRSASERETPEIIAATSVDHGRAKSSTRSIGSLRGSAAAMRTAARSIATRQSANRCDDSARPAASRNASCATLDSAIEPAIDRRASRNAVVTSA